MKIKIGFVGSPFSGKTTTAAHVFAELKRTGLPVEFLPEYAREHIRNVRAENSHVTLGDDDQHTIFVNQGHKEWQIMNYSGDDVIMISDGSTVNAFFYLENPKALGEYSVNFEKEVSKYDILFFSRNIDRTQNTVDGNRVHNKDFSHYVDADMVNKFRYGDKTYMNIIELEGGVDERVAKALSAIAEMIEMLKGEKQ